MDNINKEAPLVTILIISYNSEKFILETLESAKAQTYSNIQLIVSDDCSKDNTIDIIENWLITNGACFKETLIIASEENTGINANCNRGLKKATGDWMKLIAGDDILIKTCIEENINFINNNKDELPKIVASQIIPFDSHKSYNILPISKQAIFKETTSPKDQFRLLINGKFINGASVFYHTSELRKIGGFTSKVKMLEDFPTFLQLTKNGNKIFFLAKPTVKYRIHEKSVSNQSKDKAILPEYYKEIIICIDYFSKVSDVLTKIIAIWNSNILKIIFLLGNKGKLTECLNLLRKKFSPIHLLKLYSLV